MIKMQRGLFVLFHFLALSLCAQPQEQMFRIHHAVHAPMIDGYREEVWYSAATEHLSRIDDSDAAEPDGLLDLCGTVQMLWDSQYLYVFVQVTDDEISVTSADYRLNDGIVLFIDGDHSKTFEGTDSRDVQICIPYYDPRTPEGDENIVIDDWESLWSEAYGYRIEAALPLADLQIVPAAGSAFGLEIQFNDRDHGMLENRMRWHSADSRTPDWAHLWGDAGLSRFTADDFYAVSKTPVAPVIDGVLDACWENQCPSLDCMVPLYTPTYPGAYPVPVHDLMDWQDIHMCFRTLWDDSALYMWCEVRDDEISISDTAAALNDGIALYLKGYDFKSDQGILWEYIHDWTWVTGSRGWPEEAGIFAWGDRTDGLSGYTFELKLPFSGFLMDEPPPCKFGLEIQVNDRDADAWQNGLRWWSESNMITGFYGPAAFVIPEILKLEFPSEDNIVMHIDSVYAIRWTAGPEIERVRIELIDLFHRVVAVIAESADAHQPFEWLVPNNLPVTRRYRIKISDADDPEFNDVSKYMFDVILYPRIDVDIHDPQNGYSAGNRCTIVWLGKGDIGDSLRIDLITASEQMNITTLASGESPFIWTVPDTVPLWTGCRIRITSLHDSSVYGIGLHEFDIVDMSGVRDPKPLRTFLNGNYPNPFNPTTMIRFELSCPCDVRLSVFDILGRCVFEVRENRDAGTHAVLWDGTDLSGRPLPGGMFFCRLETGEYRAVRKMVMVR
ncbi:hypothetical protein JW948_18665 [bacterium]|nr:hypothetical protein [bacterium]